MPGQIKPSQLVKDFFRASEALVRKRKSHSPLHVVLAAPAGSGVADVCSRLRKQGFAVSSQSLLASALVAADQSDEMSNLRQRAMQQWKDSFHFEDIQDSKGGLVFYNRAPILTGLPPNVSLLYLKSEDVVMDQKLAGRLALETGEMLKTAPLRVAMGDEDPEYQHAVREFYKSDISPLADLTVDSISTKQAVGRIISAFDIGFHMADFAVRAAAARGRK